MYDQIYKYFDQFLSKYQCRFWQSYKTQNCLLAMVKKWKATLDKGRLSGTLLSSTVQWFRCFPKHNILITKIVANEFDSYSLSLFLPKETRNNDTASLQELRLYSMRFIQCLI